MNYSVIIPTCNRQKDLSMAIDSLVRQTIPPMEVIIIDQSDNSCARDYIEGIKSEYKTRIKFVYIFQAEKGSARARNRGIDIAKGDFVSFLDDDVVLFRDYFEAVIRYFEQNPDIGGISGNVILEKRTRGWKRFVRKFISRIFLLSNFRGRMTVSGFGFPVVYEREIDKPVCVELLTGCNMNIRREFLRDERFDEWFTGYSYREDVDLSYRISRKAALVMIPDAQLYHNVSSSNRQNIKTRKVMEFKNYYYIFRKYKYVNFLSNILFFHSLNGLIIIGIFEFLTSWRIKKLNELWSIALASLELLRGLRSIDAKEPSFE